MGEVIILGEKKQVFPFEQNADKPDIYDIT